MSSGSTASARAIATRLRMPPDSSPGSWSSVPASSTCSRTRRVMAAISAGVWRPCSRSRKPTFSATVSEARSAEDWKTMAMRKGFSSGGRARYSPSSIPPTVMRPASGRSRPTICRSSTDFPVPLWPTMASSSPGATRRSTPASTTCSPYAFRTPASSTETPCRRSAAGLAILGGCRGNHGGCGERSGGCERRARSSLLRRAFRHASSVVAALAALAPRLVRLAHHDYPDGLLGVDLERYLAARARLVERALAARFPPARTRLRQAMRYSLLAGGKRIRPVLALAAGEVCGAPARRVLPFACALEMIHTYSLVHDDLPAMDDDDLRRGQPTSHKVWGEGLAILVGDALLTEAFRVMAGAPGVPPARALGAVAEVAAAAGEAGMVGGQALDLAAEGSRPSLRRVQDIHRRKTGALLRSAVRVGALVAGAERRQAARGGSRAGAQGRATAAARPNDRSAAKPGEHWTGPQRP